MVQNPLQTQSKPLKEISQLPNTSHPTNQIGETKPIWSAHTFHPNHPNPFHQFGFQTITQFGFRPFHQLVSNRSKGQCGSKDTIIWPYCSLVVASIKNTVARVWCVTKEERHTRVVQGAKEIQEWGHAVAGDDGDRGRRRESMAVEESRRRDARRVGGEGFLVIEM